MTISLNKILQRKAVMAALEQAAREQAKAFDTLMRYAKCDESSTGALVPRISVISGLSGAVVRRHLRGARDAGQVIERGPSRPGGMSRWWPVGLFDKLQAEGTLAELNAMMRPVTPAQARKILDAREKRKAERAAQEGGAV